MRAGVEFEISLVETGTDNLISPKLPELDVSFFGVPPAFSAIPASLAHVCTRTTMHHAVFDYIVLLLSHPQTSMETTPLTKMETAP